MKRAALPRYSLGSSSRSISSPLRCAVTSGIDFRTEERCCPVTAAFFAAPSSREWAVLRPIFPARATRQLRIDRQAQAARPGLLACGGIHFKTFGDFDRIRERASGAAGRSPVSSPTRPATNRGRARAPAACASNMVAARPGNTGVRRRTRRRTQPGCACAAWWRSRRVLLGTFGCFSHFELHQERDVARKFAPAYPTSSASIPDDLDEIVALRVPGQFGFSQFQMWRQRGDAATRLPRAASVPTAPPNCSTRARCAA